MSQVKRKVRISAEFSDGLDAALLETQQRLEELIKAGLSTPPGPVFRTIKTEIIQVERLIVESENLRGGKGDPPVLEPISSKFGVSTLPNYFFSHKGPWYGFYYVNTEADPPEYIALRVYREGRIPGTLEQDLPDRSNHDH